MMQNRNFSSARQGVVSTGVSLPASGASLGLYTELMPNPERRFGEQTSMFTDLAVMGAERGIEVVALTPGYATSQSGWKFQQGTWQWCELSLPKVILRRSGSFRGASMKEAEKDLSLFRRMRRLHTLPRICGNKWAILSQFRKVKSLSGYLPQTFDAVSADDVLRCLDAQKDVYIKPLAGAQGISVYHVRKGNHGFRVRYERRKVSRQTERLTSRFQPDTRVIEAALPNRSSFQSFWRSTGLRRCLVQETIHLPRLQGERPFDFRWLVQYIDRPKIIARVARVGRINSVTTNIHTGGTAMAAEQALRLAAIPNTAKVIERLDDVALSVAEQLKKLYGPYAEVGVDLACRPDASIVIFEVNPTPGRRMLRALGDECRKLSLECLLEYAIRAAR